MNAWLHRRRGHTQVVRHLHLPRTGVHDLVMRYCDCGRVWGTAVTKRRVEGDAPW